MTERLKELRGTPVTPLSMLATRASLWSKLLREGEELDERARRVLAMDLERCADNLRAASREDHGR